MGGFIDLSGSKFERLIVLKRMGTKHQSPLWKCKCDCGNEVLVTTRSLKSKNTQSCGCIHSEQLIKRNNRQAKHNGEKERLYGVWHAMKQRCYDKNRKDFKNYGGRGIEVCEEWRNDYSAFRQWALKNKYNPEADFMTCTLDRINVNGSYEPSNCRWVDMKFQANNRRKKVVV